MEPSPGWAGDMYAIIGPVREARVKRFIRKLKDLQDRELFGELSHGMPLIVDNAVSLDETAYRLYREKDFRASDIMRGFAEEEAAKFLILLDFVRCPQKFEQRLRMLNRFYDHTEKRVYAMTCSPSIATFQELSEFVESLCKPYYLDGPNWVDFIFPNSISSERDELLYVDYVQDITDTNGACQWHSPTDQARCRDSMQISSLPYATPDCLNLIRALSEAGTSSPEGLAEIAKIWRKFAPEPDTHREDIRARNLDTLDRLERIGSTIPNDSAKRFIVSHWSFPMWGLSMRKSHVSSSAYIEELRDERERTVIGIEKTTAKRHPKPAISRSKIEKLSDAYAAWQRDADARTAGRAEGKSGRERMRPLNARDTEKDFEIPSYADLRDMFRKLTTKERAALLALAWFTRGQIADWTQIYQDAIEREPMLDESYQLNLANCWLDGLERWEEKPRPFQAGRWYRPKHS